MFNAGLQRGREGREKKRRGVGNGKTGNRGLGGTRREWPPPLGVKDGGG